MVSGKPVRRPSRTALTDETHDAIMSLIVNHQIAPDEHINIDALARGLNVSQTPIREALARLESENLVVKQPLRGYAATPLLTPTQADHMFRFRALLEPQSAARAAEQHTSADAEAMKAELETGRRIDHSDFDRAYAELGAHDQRFHDLVAAASGSKYLRDAIARLHCHLHMFRLYQSRKSSSLARSMDKEYHAAVFKDFYSPETGFLTVHGHSQIAEAIFARDARKAEATMFEHIDGSRLRNAPAVELIGKL